MPRRAALIQVAVAATAMGVLPAAHRHVDAWAPPEPDLDDTRFLPSGELLSALAFGYEPVVADLLWVWATLMFGERVGIEEDALWYGWIYHIADLATDLDPRFVRAYKYGGIMLHTSTQFVDASSLLFAKGMHHVPDEYYLPYGVAMNYYLHHENAEVAADYMRRASVLPKAPFYYRNLAASMLTESNRASVALQFLRDELQGLPPGRARVATEVKVAELEYQVAADAAREAILARKAQMGRLPEYPEGPDGAALTADPLGGRWVWSYADGAREAEVISDREAAYFAELAERTGLGTGAIRDQRAAVHR